MTDAKKVILFYNPHSGDTLVKHNLDNIIARYQNAGYLIVPIRAADGHIIYEYLGSLNRETYKQEFRQIIAAGGDGTVHVCVNAMMENQIDLPLAVFPSGTDNGFASYFDIPEDLNRMIDVALGEHLMQADVGRINDKYFVNMTTIGSVIGVKQSTDPLVKEIFGVIAYYIQALLNVRQLKGNKVRLTCSEGVFDEEMYFMMVINGRPGIGRFRKAAKEAEIDDGMLDVLLFRKVRFYQIPSAMLQLIKGAYKNSKYFLHLKTANLKVESAHKLPVDIDGEYGDAFPLEFSNIHKCLKIYTAENKGDRT